MASCCDGGGRVPLILHGCKQNQQAHNPLLEYIARREAGHAVALSYWGKTLFATSGRAMPVFPLVVYTLYCIGCVTWTILYAPHFHSLDLSVLTSLMNLVGTSLFLLQAFRVNSSYERWWEGRKLWDQIQASSSDLGRMTLGWLTDRDLALRMLHWIMAFAVAGRDQLRHTHDLAVMEGVLPAADMQRWVAARSKPKYAALQMTQLIRKAQDSGVLSGSVAGSCDAKISSMLQALGSCTRIKHTPMPFAYIVHLRSFLVLWLLVLPWSFVQTLHWWTTPACIILGYQLLGFEEIGVEIESPFGAKLNQLDLDSIVEDIHNDVRNKIAMLGDAHYLANS